MSRFRTCISSAAAKPRSSSIGGKIPPGEVTELIHRFAQVGAQLVEKRLGSPAVIVEEPACQAQLRAHGDKRLLGAVVKIPLDPTALLILSGDDPLAGGLEFLQSLSKLRGQP